MTIEILKKAQRIFVYDTETTGFPIWQEKSDHPNQPHLVDLCGILYSADGEIIEVMESLVKPDGWTISDEVSKIHGITNDYAVINGQDERQVLALFGRLHKQADIRVAHNIQFDDRIMRIAIKRFFGEEPANRFREKSTFCTANAAKPLCQIPPTAKMLASRFKNQFKTPNLTEALKHFTGEDLDGAHRAKVDTIGCAKVLFAILKTQQVQP